jgi:hypothetical protein
MARTFFDDDCWNPGDRISLTSFYGPSTLKDRRNLQLTIHGQDCFGDRNVSFISLTMEEAQQIRDQLDRFIDDFSGLQGDDLQEFDSALVEVS